MQFINLKVNKNNILQDFSVVYTQNLGYFSEVYMDKYGVEY